VMLAAIDARIRAVVAPGRNAVRVVMSDASTESSAVYHGLIQLLPMPGWRGWGREIRYEAY
jgi:hypothetical protein